MKCLIALILLVVAWPTFADCYATAYTQGAMNACAGAEAGGARERLEHTVTMLKQAYRDDEVFIKALMRSQLLFEKSLEADTYLKYPNRDPNAYGSVYPMCQNAYQTGLIEQRIAFLQQWLDGVEEGDVCSGSIKFTP
ncbi:lysozyme inhibitor LprI family protein [Gilvimarinus sp. SDUM040013]|uniref:Lysozyme inhibitor LprI family protein n=1 Tax=Gilvimarinus gilvus TaxID=3058038 RepID=A0ABU4RXN7_9GAMM|nr:lysozyme inhibitor LprI family protein [Gilvimarinus sp. SDUM040013]MDO3388733.1 lysozyme inhibitor LprI family protein [Gilvimarinus sp. SDUM040013]MDX6849628.1 lysozyme inhibitor LprI family protein [Gilvimarinus sp. SDUM040013]